MCDLFPDRLGTKKVPSALSSSNTKDVFSCPFLDRLSTRKYTLLYVHKIKMLSRTFQTLFSRPSSHSTLTRHKFFSPTFRHFRKPTQTNIQSMFKRHKRFLGSLDLLLDGLTIKKVHSAVNPSAINANTDNPDHFL